MVCWLGVKQKEVRKLCANLLLFLVLFSVLSEFEVMIVRHR